MSSLQGSEAENKALQGGAAKDQGYEGDLSSTPAVKDLSSEGEAQAPTADKNAQDVNPSLFQKLKGKFLGGEANPGAAKKTDPAEPAASPKAGILSQVQQSLWGKKGDAPGPKAGEGLSSGTGAGAGSGSGSGSDSGSSKIPVSVPPTDAAAVPSLMKAKDGAVSDELGTGYEEDTERSAISSDSSADMGKAAEEFPPQSESLFKPVEPKDDTELSLEDLRQRKASDDVKAPGVMSRAYEEVEAVTDQLLEGLNVKSGK